MTLALALVLALTLALTLTRTSGSKSANPNPNPRAQDPAYDEALEGGEALEQERSARSESGRTPAESVSGWLAEAMVVLADADEGAALEAEP